MEKGVEGKVVIGAFDFESTTSSKLLGISTNAITRNSASVVAGITITGGTKKVVFQVQGAATYPSDSSFFVRSKTQYLFRFNNDCSSRRLAKWDRSVLIQLITNQVMQATWFRQNTQ